MITNLPSLVQIDEEHEVVSEAGDPVSGGHGDDEREHVIDERVERLVHERAPRKCCHRPQPVVDEQLRQHEQEPERVHAVHHRVQGPRVPAAFFTQLDN
jgi:hypothetical protein